MWQRNFLLLMILSVLTEIKSDCGCNKLNREDPESSNNILTTEENICQQKVASNKYRDYYEDKEKVEEVNDHDYDNKPEMDAMSLIPGGKYMIGTNEPFFREDDEGPERLVDLKDFYMDKFEVSNSKFEKFVEATNFTTDAEKFGDSFIFKTLLTEKMQQEFIDYRVHNALWWYKVTGVSWKHPNGPQSDLNDLWQHPVVHVSWNDAQAYCKWEGKRLPTEAEWEVACKGGRQRKLYPWGNKMTPKDQHWMNIWQGEFPNENTKEDGFEYTCPVDKFRQNVYDLYNIVGNVWEWTEDSWLTKKKASKDNNINKVKKGGSYLCHKQYCYRYRCAARSHNTVDSTAGNLGFRCAKDVKI